MLRLTERLNLLGSQPSDNKHEESINIATSLRNYLQKILNTKIGSVLCSPQMGLPYINISEGIGVDSGKEHILKQIQVLLLKFDPRIVTITTQLKNNHNLTTILAFQLSLTTQSKQNISMLAKLQSDNTFELELQ
jgi:type VI secretion system protein